MESWLEIMGTMLGTNTEDGNASKVLEYGASVQEEITNIVNEIPEDTKPKVLYISGHSEDEILQKLHRKICITMLKMVRIGVILRQCKTKKFIRSH